MNEPHELEAETHRRIVELSQAGDALAESGRVDEALNFYQSALTLLPEPQERWEAATWLQSAIGDAYFGLGNWPMARSAFLKAVVSIGGLGNPFVHLRLGQCAFECGDLEAAADELTRAFMGAGEGVFEGSDPKYLAFLKQRLQ